MKEDDTAKMFGSRSESLSSLFAKFIHSYSEQQERHMDALLHALELLDDSIKRGFSDVEDQLENIGDALRELEPSDTEYSDSNRPDQNERADNRS